MRPFLKTLAVLACFSRCLAVAAATTYNVDDFVDSILEIRNTPGLRESFRENKDKASLRAFSSSWYGLSEAERGEAGTIIEKHRYTVAEWLNFGDALACVIALKDNPQALNDLEAAIADVKPHAGPGGLGVAEETIAGLEEDIRFCREHPLDFLKDSAELQRLAGTLGLGK
jgi:hypothetical protein